MTGLSPDQNPICFRSASAGTVKGNRVKIPNDPVTVNGERGSETPLQICCEKALPSHRSESQETC